MNNDGNPEFKDSKPKAKFHGEASMREEFGHMERGQVYWSPNANRTDIEQMVVEMGGKLVRRTVSVSQWVEVDA